MKRKGSGPPPSPERDATRDETPRRCPRCKRRTFTFAPSVAVIVQPTLVRGANERDEDRRLRLLYKPAWLCRHDKCGYLRLVRK